MTGQALLSIAYAAVTLSILSMADGFSNEDASALKANLTRNYDKNTNPSYDLTKDVNVSVYFILNAIGNIDEKLEKWTTTMYLNVHWKDEFITWDNSETDIRYLTFDKSEVWVPEFFVFNTHYDISYTKQDDLYPPVQIGYDGRAVFFQRVISESSCSLDMTNFPFDHHKCSIEFVANRYALKTNLNLDQSFSSDGTWDVIDTSLAEETHNQIVLSITFARKSTFFLVNLISPMTILALLSPLVFLLPNSSGDRIGFSVTILLALAVFMTMVADQVPQKSQPLPGLIYILFASYSLTALVNVIVIVNARIHVLPDRKPVPCFLAALVKCMRCFCFRRRSATTNEEQGDGLSEISRNAEAEVGYRKVTEFGAVTWHDVSWTIDILAMTIIYLLKIALLAITFGVRKSEDDAASSFSFNNEDYEH